MKIKQIIIKHGSCPDQNDNDKSLMQYQVFNEIYATLEDGTTTKDDDYFYVAWNDQKKDCPRYKKYANEKKYDQSNILQFINKRIDIESNIDNLADLLNNYEIIKAEE